MRIVNAKVLYVRNVFFRPTVFVGTNLEPPILEILVTPLGCCRPHEIAQVVFVNINCFEVFQTANTVNLYNLTWKRKCVFKFSKFCIIFLWVNSVSAFVTCSPISSRWLIEFASFSNSISKDSRLN